MIGQIELVGEAFLAELAYMRGGLGVLDHHVPMNTILMTGGHVAERALIHTLASLVHHFPNEPRGCIFRNWTETWTRGLVTRTVASTWKHRVLSLCIVVGTATACIVSVWCVEKHARKALATTNVLVQVVFVPKHFAAVLADVVGRPRVHEDHVPFHVGTNGGKLAAQRALETVH